MKEINQKFEEEKLTLPNSCYVEFSKSTKIQNKDPKIKFFDANYMLVSHPHPLLEGEMLLLQTKKED